MNRYNVKSLNRYNGEHRGSDALPSEAAGRVGYCRSGAGVNRLKPGGIRRKWLISRVMAGLWQFRDFHHEWARTTKAQRQKPNQVRGIKVRGMREKPKMQIADAESAFGAWWRKLPGRLARKKENDG
jgi:hypothetical protein